MRADPGSSPGQALSPWAERGIGGDGLRETDIPPGCPMTARGLIVAAPRSGSGKTTMTLALLAALRRRGVAVGAAKAGPDYIDGAFHAAATGRPCVNLDSWAMPPALLDALAREAASAVDFLAIEGVMGLFDGAAGPRGRTGAAADLAARLALPVLLVLDVSGQSQTAAAVLRGLASHDPAVRIGGVILNRIASERHRALVADAVAAVGIPLLGAVPRSEELALPERHLGLVQAKERRDLTARLDHLADVAERHLDLDGITAMAMPMSSTIAEAAKAPPDLPAALPPSGRRIALASDAAFTFVYPHVLAGWRRAGAEIATFSPLADEAPPDSCDACWLPGGYPELHASPLAHAARFRDGLRHFAQTRPVHGECGGYMVLGEALVDAAGTPHAMAGLLRHVTSFQARKLHLGYRVARLLHDGPLGPKGTVIRGHEFHYASVVTLGDEASFADFTDAQGHPLGVAGGRRGQVTGTFFHAIATQPECSFRSGEAGAGGRS
jgi:cobyrinic acid a,c-diamide synthase